MALPSSGAITVKQINAEFGGSNTLKSNATIASISTSNVGCKSFYGLSAAIDPAYIQEDPVTSITGWIGATNISGGYVQDFTSVPPSKIAIGNARAELRREVTVTPGVTYTWSCRIDHNDYSTNNCIHRVYEKLDWAVNGNAGTVLGTSGTFTASDDKFISVTFSSPLPEVYLIASVTGDPIESSFNSGAGTAYASARVRLTRVEL